RAGRGAARLALDPRLVVLRRARPEAALRGAALRTQLVAAVDRLGHAGRPAHQLVDGARHGDLVADRAAPAQVARHHRRGLLRRGAALGDVAGDGADDLGRPHRAHAALEAAGQDVHLAVVEV